MAEGYIKLFRKIQDHQLWHDKPFSKGQAWIDLLLMANHKEAKFLLGNELVSAEAGQIITSEVRLSERWGWSRCKVRAFLELLQSDSMLLKKSDSKKTVLTLCNYSVYNETETTKKQQKNSVQTSKRQRSDTIKNVENIDISSTNVESISCVESEIQNSSGGKEKSPRFEHESKAYRCAAFLDETLAKRLDRPGKKEDTLQKWSDAFDKTNRLDKWSWKKIGAVLDCLCDEDDKRLEFWRPNILSGETFRKQFEKLYAKLGEAP